MAPPGGLPWNCASDQSVSRTLQIGATAGWLDSTLDLGQAGRVDLSLESLVVSVGFPLQGSWTGRVSVGAVSGGDLVPAEGTDATFDGGFLAAVALEKSLPRDGGFIDQIDWSVSLSTARADTRDDAGTEGTYSAVDLRFGGRAAKRVSGAGVAYLAGAVFGGPVKWERAAADVSGSDVHHFRLALGTAWQVNRIGVFAEWSGVGERGVAAGLSTLW